MSRGHLLGGTLARGHVVSWCQGLEFRVLSLRPGASMVSG